MSVPLKNNKFPDYLNKLLRKEIEPNVFIFNKPVGFSSYTIVDMLKQTIRRPVGHAGTLDPLANGELILGVYPGTKRLSVFGEVKKEYMTDVLWGYFSESVDLETPLKILKCNSNDFSIAEIEKSLERLAKTKKIKVGKHSALKHKGSSFYKQEEDLYRFHNNIIFESALLSNKKVKKAMLLKQLKDLKLLISKNKKWYKTLRIRYRAQQMILFDNLIKAIDNNINIINTSTCDIFYKSTIKLVVGKGTYIRYGVKFLGDALKSGAVTLSIRRNYVFDDKVSL